MLILQYKYVKSHSMKVNKKITANQVASKCEVEDELHFAERSTMNGKQRRRQLQMKKTLQEEGKKCNICFQHDSPANTKYIYIVYMQPIVILSSCFR